VLEDENGVEVKKLK